MVIVLPDALRSKLIYSKIKIRLMSRKFVYTTRYRLTWLLGYLSPHRTTKDCLYCPNLRCPMTLKCQTIYDNLSLSFGMCATVLRNTVSEIFVEALNSYIRGFSKKSVDRYYFFILKNAKYNMGNNISKKTKIL